jgi:PAS domain S-box-containing protein
MPRAVAPEGSAIDLELLRLLVQSAPDYAIFTLDPTGVVTSWNTGARRMKGYEADEIIGQHFSRFYPESAISVGHPEHELAVASAEGRYEEEGWRLRKDGTRFWANVVITALRGDDGRLLGFGKVTRDLTERKRAEEELRESEERLRILVQSVADYAIFMLTPDGEVATWNTGAERLKGYRHDEIVGQRFDRFYTAEDQRAGVPRRVLESALRDGRSELEGWRVRKDGSRFWANVVITALYGADGRHRGFAKVTRDLTARKRSEDALREALDRERLAAEQLRELDRMRTDLMAIVAHDVRGPITVLQGFADLLLSEWDTMPDEEKRMLVERTAGRARDLGEFVNDVFDVARIESGELRLTIEPFDVAALADTIVADARTATPSRPIRLEATGPAVALGDEHRTWQVLSNLVANAVKFSPASEPVVVTIEVDATEVVVSVRDRGPGIDDDQQAVVFDRFARLPQSAGTPGSGMGLYIARSLAEAQGGRIWVESAPGEGATFRFCLPSAPDTPR